MGKLLGRTAAKAGLSERTLRRYVNDGLLRAHRVTGQLELSASEERYLSERLELLTGLRAALRTERNVRLAVLFGSIATGEDGDDSDLDLLVGLRDGGMPKLAGVLRRLEDALGRKVHLVSLDDALTAPSLLIDVIDEGRVLVDRDDGWAAIRSSRDLVARRARRHEVESTRRAAATISAARRRAGD
jgi:predicted nucleotidyltransferase